MKVRELEDKAETTCEMKVMERGDNALFTLAVNSTTPFCCFSSSYACQWKCKYQHYCTFSWRLSACGIEARGVQSSDLQLPFSFSPMQCVLGCILHLMTSR